MVGVGVGAVESIFPGPAKAVEVGKEACGDGVGDRVSSVAALPQPTPTKPKIANIRAAIASIMRRVMFNSECLYPLRIAKFTIIRP